MIVLNAKLDSKLIAIIATLVMWLAAAHIKQTMIANVQNVQLELCKSAIHYALFVQLDANNAQAPQSVQLALMDISKKMITLVLSVKVKIVKHVPMMQLLHVLHVLMVTI